MAPTKLENVRAKKFIIYRGNWIPQIPEIIGDFEREEIPWGNRSEYRTLLVIIRPINQRWRK